MGTASVKKTEEEFFTKGKGKKKRQRAKKAAPSAPFILSVDSFEQFGSVGLNPPTKLEQVEGSVKELREKKDWYSKQPRGSVPTAKDIRKKNEKKHQKLRQIPSAAPSGSFSASMTHSYRLEMVARPFLVARFGELDESLFLPSLVTRWSTHRTLPPLM